MGVWSLLDGYRAPKVLSGIVALVLLFILAFAAADKWLDRQAKTWSPMVSAVVVWFWTCGLAIASILVWRLMWWYVDEQVIEPGGLLVETKQIIGTPGWAKLSNARCILLFSVGTVVLIATGRFPLAVMHHQSELCLICRQEAASHNQPSLGARSRISLLTLS